MKVFTAVLLAASALAETYDLINEDTQMNWSGELMTLTTSITGDEIEFCINAIARKQDLSIKPDVAARSS